MNPISNSPPGRVLWFTGLSAAGKTTLSAALCTHLRSLGYQVEHLDGDVVRRGMCSDLGFSREDRHENVRRITRAAAEMVHRGVIVLVSAMSPYRDARAEARSRIPEFTEIYVNAPVEACERRDTKGLYQRARMGKVSDVPGVDSPYEPPLDAEVECHTDRETVEESLAKVMRYLTPLLEPARAVGQSES